MKKVSYLLVSLLFSSEIIAQSVTLAPNKISTPNLSYNAIVVLPSPQKGDMAFDNTFNCLRVYNGTKWVSVSPTSSNNSQTIAAIATGGGSNNDFGNCIAVDTNGNLYVGGNYQGPATFGGTTLTGNGLFVAKYNSSGNLIWIQSIAGSGSLNDIALDANENVYITGRYAGLCNFGGGTLTSANASNDIFLAKYNNAGSLQMLKSAGGNGSDSGEGIAIDASNNIYITGYFAGLANFQASPSNVTLVTTAAKDLFVIKFFNNFVVHWITQGNSTDAPYGMAGSALTVDASGYVYVTGYFGGSFSYSISTKTSAGGADVFFGRLFISTGSPNFYATAGGTNDDLSSGISTDGAGNAVISGYFSGLATFAPNLSTSTLTSTGSNDIFMAKFSFSTNSWEWAKSAGTTSDESATKIALDASGNCYLIGRYFAPGNIFGNVYLTSNIGGFDVFVAKFNTTGQIQWVQTGGSNYWDYANDICIDAAQNICIIGSYGGTTATFGSTTISQLSPNPATYDMFIVRVSQ